MFNIKSIIVLSGSCEGHFIEHRGKGWVISSRKMVGAKVYPNIIQALSALERASGVPCEMFEAAYPDAAIVPIMRRVG